MKRNGNKNDVNLDTAGPALTVVTRLSRRQILGLLLLPAALWLLWQLWVVAALLVLALIVAAGLEPARLYYTLMPALQQAHRAHVVVDVSPYVGCQLRAMRCYQSQRGCWRRLLEQVGEEALRRQRFYLAWSSRPQDYNQRDGTDLFAGLV